MKTRDSTTLIWMAGWSATAAGLIGFSSLAFVILYILVGPPFGTLIEISIGIVAVFTAFLAVMIYPSHHKEVSLFSQLGLGMVLCGAIVVVSGAILVMTGVTGVFLENYFMAAGFALIGFWLFILTFSAFRKNLWPGSLVVLGLVSGAVMMLGLAAIPGLISGVNPQQSSSLLVTNVVQAGALGWLVLYPAWCLLLGRQFIYSISI